MLENCVINNRYKEFSNNCELKTGIRHPRLGKTNKLLKANS